ncbi:MAG: penicillin-binding transpeptidase domain-containing protein [Candidatus Sumerlaeia bacterium]
MTKDRPIRHRDPDEPPTRDDVPFVQGRLNLLVLAFGLVAVVFAMQIYKLSILKGPEYRKESEENFMREESIAAPRGRILDRHGRPIAINRTVFQVDMAPLKLSADEITSTVAGVARLIGKPSINQLATTVIRKRPRENSVMLAEGLTLDQVLPLLEQRFQLPGVSVHTSYERVYPEGEITGGITGHVGGIPESELDGFLERGYLREEMVGRSNAERTFEGILHGTPGVEILSRDHLGRTRSRRLHKPVQPGNTIYTTIDLGMQRLADALLADWRGFIVAMDPQDGGIIAMSYHPGYDPNFPTRGHQFNPIYQKSRPINGRYPGYAPGSTFKIVTAAAGLMAGFSPSQVINCGGYITLGGKTKFWCDQTWGHDGENFLEAMMHSCNIYFYTWGRQVGARALTDMARGFGFGAETGFEMAMPGAENPGHVANPDIDPIYAGSVLHMAIGQGEMISVTPIQMARAYAALCNGGTLLRPRLIKEIRTADDHAIGEVEGPDGAVWQVGQAQPQGKLQITEEARKTICEGLWRVTHDPTGTGRHAGFKPEWNVCGKTGTAQTGRKIPDAWFVCYAPAEKPNIVIVILIEESGHGGTYAGPLARQLLACWNGRPEPQIVPPPHEPPKVAGTGN